MSESSSDSEGAASDASTPRLEVTDEQKAQSEELKTKANAKFQENHFAEATDFYTKAIELNPRNHILHANRAFCHIKMENYGIAITDSTEAINLDPSYIKGYYRRGTAHLALNKLKLARADFREAVKREPHNKDARAKMDECEKAIRKERFEKAIESETPTRKSMSADDIQVESSYKGPHLENGQVTETFIADMIAHFKAEKRLHAKYALQILLQVLEVLKSEETVVDVPVPDGEHVNVCGDEHVNVCGDVHGQFYDLCNIFETAGKPSEKNPFLFNGDFVDRGSFGVETVLLLFAYKVLYPNHMHLNRGNHETVNMNKMYGFEGEIKAKYKEVELMPLLTDIFQWLPLAHVIGGKVLVLHGGLFSKDETTLNDVRKIQRHQEPPDEGPMTELLWSDPGSLKGRQASKRGVGVAFGPDVAERFLGANGLDLLIRSHECKDEGYEVEHGGKTITVFSAPNYCDQMGNKGAVIRLTGPSLKPVFTQ
eukprot:CAMPEP_0172211722 /NCGR_PEP_ID=MMETSP1050-20130122/36569_1 /TAXON_ID=233186 /ORGANISM="Cryptomonas curvata, Strain CCAP979/52" /LENGTH=483 /DNA_ID=CAMNT_0012892223 /DNA_START=6 /DNA_END=1455 /DNA_ORIENTATION=+